MPKLNDLFPCAGFQLGVLEALMTAGAVNKEQLNPLIQTAVAPFEKFIAEEEGDRVVEDQDNVEAILRGVLATLGTLDLTAEQLAQVEAIHFDGGNEIYIIVEGESESALQLFDGELDTGGESSIYQVTNFTGIEALPNLKTLDLDGHGYCETERDNAPLEKIVGLTVTGL